MYRRSRKNKLDTSTNKKIKNAQVTIYNNIQFKSKLEVYAYKKLMEAGIEFEYEAKTFTLWEGFKPISTRYFKSTKTQFALVDRKVLNTTYTPDFVGIGWIMETKGQENDQYAIKCKMFRKLIEGSEYKLFLEPHSQKHIDECISMIKEFLVKTKTN